jgi:hypothetical protein
MDEDDNIHSPATKYILTHGIKQCELISLTFVDLINHIFSNLFREAINRPSYLEISECWDIFVNFHSKIISIFFQEQYILQQKHITQMLDTYLGEDIANIVQLYTKRLEVEIDFHNIKHLKETIFFKERIELYYTLFRKYELKRVTNYSKSLLNNLSHDELDNARQNSEKLSRQMQHMRDFLLGAKDCIPVYNSNMSGDHDGDFAQIYQLK